jgi:uncharacterized protein YutE (UPF0331/DUF86 family)
MNPLRLGKVALIERSIVRARVEFAAAGAGFASDFTRQDAAILNILRACEAALDLANIVIRERGLGVPQSSRDSFRLLADARVVPPELSERLQRMVGFRNIAVHQYQNLYTAVVAAILRHDLDDLLRYNRMLAALE